MLCGWMLVGALWISQQEPAQIGYETLVEGLIDLRWMCEEPRPGERSLALDGSAAAGLAVLTHEGGAGVVGRVWCSRRDGELRAYVDGSSEPVLSWNLAEFAASERAEALPPDPLAGALGAGWYSVVPISFTHSVRLVFETAGAGETRLQADLRLLGEGATVAPFDANTLKQHGPALRRVARTIADDQHPKVSRTNKTAAEAMRKQDSRISPATPYYDGTFYFPLRGSGILRWWTLKLLYVDDLAEIEAIMRGLQVSIETGTELESESGRVMLQLPFGDLFGAGAGRDPYDHYLMGLREDGTFVCRMPMPFEKHMKVVFRYPTRPAVKFLLGFGADEMPRDQVPPMRLRGGWVLEDAALSDPFQFALTGPARVVSAMWSSECSTDLAWRDAPAFAFAQQLTRSRKGAWSQVTHRDGPGRFGRFTMLRQYAHDAPVAAAGEILRFEPPSRYSGAAGESRASMRMLWYGPARLDENAGPEDRVMNFGSNYTPEARARSPLPQPNFFAIAGAFEAEGQSFTAFSDAARSEVQDWSDLKVPVSRKEVLVFHPSAAGDQFAFEVSAPIAGDYELVARLGTGPGLGGIAAFLDGRRIGEAAAVENEARTIREVVLHRGTFLPRPYQLAVRALDALPVALDCVVLRPVKP